MTTKHIPEEIILNGKRGEVYNAIKNAMPDGITRIELCKLLDVTTSSIYTNINHLNKFQSNFRIVNKNQKYFLKSSDTIPEKAFKIKKDLPINDPKIGSEKFVSFKTMEKLQLLPRADTFDILDMLKKSYYYKRSAEALLEAHEITHQIKTQMHLK